MVSIIDKEKFEESIMEDDAIVQLYVSFKEDSKSFLSLHRQHFTQFTTIILAVLAASIGASYQFKQEGLLLLAVAALSSRDLSMSSSLVKWTRKAWFFSIIFFSFRLILNVISFS